MIKEINKIWIFLTKDIWGLRMSDLSPRKALKIKALRILMLSIRGFYEDNIQQRAAALTLYTLLSIVPILAIGFGIAKGFGYDQVLKGQLMSYLESNENIKETTATNQQDVDYAKAYKQIAEQLMTFADSMLAKTKGGLMAVIALGLLFWTVMKVLGNIESSFNDIWQIKRPRPFVRKLTDYLSMMLISPVLLISITIAIVSLKTLKVHSLISPFLFILVKLSPILLIVLLFTLVFIIMPNTKVKFMPALIGGALSGIIFFIIQQVYVYFQIGVSANNAIYGGFAALPLFIIWMQLSWLILLFGAKVAFATQHIELYELENETIYLNDYSRRIVANQIAYRVIQNFEKGQKPLTPSDLSTELKIPIRMIKSILYDLVRCNILSEVLTDNPKITAFQPAQYIDNISVKFIFEKLDKLGENYIPQEKAELTKKIVAIHESFYEQIEKSSDNLLVKNIKRDNEKSPD
ncbi:MAG TPA: YihY/virulence factor BrkB family protein [Bacteroidales bacterium]|nr:YihY/virulence factor BrkB family protein [Bacteroidales bacterium]